MAVYGKLSKDEFNTEFESRVKKTITAYRLLQKKDTVVVAASGGKDSTTLLYLLKKLGYAVSALAIDEGIAGYRERNLADLKKFCTKEKIQLKIVSFKKAFGKELDVILKNKKHHPCSVCGTFRRTLMNKHAAGFDAIATGHNADDEAQAVLMNLTRANVDLFPRGGPVTTSKAQGFVRRIKPLYFCTEKEILTYALLHNLATEWNECPYAGQAYRNDIREVLNEREAAHPGTKRKVLEHYLKVKKEITMPESSAVPCGTCGEPSMTGECKACRLIITI